MKANRKRAAGVAEKRILIVDDHPMTRYGIAQLIGQEPDLEMCGEVDNADRALAAVKTLKPDLVVADLAMPGKSGLELIRDLKAQYPEVAVLVVSMHDESIYAERVLRAGGRGYLMKSAGGEKLLQAIRRVLHGKVSVSEAMSDRIMNVFAGHRPGGARDSTLAALTEREFGVFELLGQGLTTRETAKNLHISAKTVETHRSHIVDMLKLKGSSQLTKFAICW
ncbi:MAG: response regulator transcription factor, partial [Verrucomicrobiota bacterium]